MRDAHIPTTAIYCLPQGATAGVVAIKGWQQVQQAPHPVSPACHPRHPRVTPHDLRVTPVSHRVSSPCRPRVTPCHLVSPRITRVSHPRVTPCHLLRVTASPPCCPRVTPCHLRANNSSFSVSACVTCVSPRVAVCHPVSPACHPRVRLIAVYNIILVTEKNIISITCFTFGKLTAVLSTIEFEGLPMTEQ